MLPTIIDIALAYLVSRSFIRWWGLLSASLAGGAIVGATYHLSLGLLDYVPPGIAILNAISGASIHAIFCALATAAFVAIRPSSPELEDDPRALVTRPPADESSR